MGQFGSNYGANYDLAGGGPSGGIAIQGTHAIQVIGDPRKRKVTEYRLTATGKVTRQTPFEALGRIHRYSSISASSKIIKETTHRAAARITRLYDHFIAESAVYQNISKLHTFKAISDTYNFNTDKETAMNMAASRDRLIKENARKDKIKKLKKYMDTYDEYFSDGEN